MNLIQPLKRISRRALLGLSALACLCWLIPKSSPAETPAAGSDAIRVACVGDSITFGAGVKDRGRNSYPVQLGLLLGDKYVVKNFGVSGATMLRKGDKPYDKQKAYASAQEFKPNVVVIFLGTNDSKAQNWKFKDDYEGDYKDMIATFRKLDPAARVYCCRPVPAIKPGNFGIREEVINDEIIPLVDKVAAETQSTVIDLHAALSDHVDLFPDRIHPNADGAKLIANAVFHALTGKDAPAPQPAEKQL